MTLLLPLPRSRVIGKFGEVSDNAVFRERRYVEFFLRRVVLLTELMTRHQNPVADD